MTELSPAAQEVLAEYLNDRTAELRERVLRRAATYASGEVLTAQDVARATTQMGDDSRRSQFDTEWDAARRVRLRRLRILVVAYAALVLVAAAIYVVVSVVRPTEFTASVFGLVVAMIGAAAGIAAAWFALATNRQQRDSFQRSMQERLLGRFLAAWAEFEVVARQASPQSGKTLVANLDGLVRTGVLSESDLERVRQLLKVRNGIVHSADAPSPDSLGKWTDQLEELTTQVDRATRTNPSGDVVDHGAP